jgi:DNA polymerase III delta prime subunit
MKVILISKELSRLEDEEVKNTLTNKFGDNFDFSIIRPIKEESKKRLDYSVKQIKNLVAKLTRKFDATNLEPAFVVLDADKMSDISQNVFLKTLEEFKYSIFLISSTLESLLPTIQSRCQVIFTNEVEIKSKSQDDITYNDITNLSKLERDEVKNLLKLQIDNLKEGELEKVLFIDDAIRKIDANCKVESVLYELVYLLKNSIN